MLPRLAVAAFAVAAALAAARKPQKPLLLGPDPPGRLKKPAADAGAPDAGQAEVAQRLEALEKQLAAQQKRLEALEAQREDARAQARQLQQLVDEVRSMRASLLSAEEARRGAEEEAQESREAAQEAAAGLRAVDRRLAAGDERGALEAIAAAQATFPAPAQPALAAAAQALRNRDLSGVRAALASALAQSRY